ncbi:hypothetical protein [Streptosporangium roseum]|uniref:hypothetical protein n=1 Tax=Streptosporangium roseum TaxID=2001 RepID=UPI00332FDDE4
MPLPQPEGLEDRIIALERAIVDLRTSITNQGGITTASAGLIFPSQAAPATPASGGHLHAEGTEPYWKDSSGSNRAIIQDLPSADYVPNPPSFIVSSAPGVYQTAWAQDLRDAVANLNSTVTSALTEFKASGQMDPF